MNPITTDEPAKELVLSYDLDAPPDKVWRAISLAAFRDKWLPKEHLASPEAVIVTPGHTLSCRMREAGPPFLESVVTFHITPHAGGTRLRIIHELTDARFMRRAANSNGPPLMRAA